ncbi:hypothetical protein [Actinopolyspora mortivallis]|uniref:hypothetical protein n=1 Tax=Actinopolyspora mortivallis TaxID=33906 RepID=UPI0012EDC4E9|nr:hypothetical protein [Actinopolyspora mortivallis]
MSAFIEARARIFERGKYTPFSAMRWLRRLAMIKKIPSQYDHYKTDIVLYEWWRLIGPRHVLLWQSAITITVMQIPFGLAGYVGFLDYVELQLGWLTVVAIAANRWTIVFFALKRSIRASKPVSLQIRSLRNPIRLIGASIGTGVGIIAGLVSAAAYSIPLGVGVGVSIGAIAVLYTASSEAVPIGVKRPMDPLFNDRRFSLVIGFVLGAYAVLYYSTIYGVRVAVLYGMMCVLGAVCSSAYMRYVIAVFYGWTLGFPLRLNKFLAWCYDSGILRQSGSGYQFRHQELEEFLSAQGQ